VLVANSTTMRLKNTKSPVEKIIEVKPDEVGVYQDPFSYFADVVKGRIKVPKNGLYSLENNVTVVRILDAARESAASGKTVVLKKK
jgi:predicted dehydrogenase